MPASKLSLKSSLFITIAIPGLALLVVAAATISTMANLRSQSAQLYLNTAMPMRSMAEVASRIPRMRVGIDVMLLQETPLRDERGVNSRVKDARDEDIPEMRKAMQDAVQAQVNPELRQQVQRLADEFEQVVSNQLNPMLSALEQGELDKARQIYKDDYHPSYTRMRKEAGVLMDKLLTQAQETHEYSELSYGNGWLTLVLIIAAAVLISICVSLLIGRNIQQRVRYLLQTLSYASTNLSLTEKIRLDGTDELSQIAASFNNFVDNVHQAITQLAANAHELAQMAGSVSSQSLLTHRNCIAQSERTVQVATAMHEMGATVSEIANNAAKAADLAGESTVSTAEGSSVVGRVREQIGVMDQELLSATKVVESLASQIHAISTTLDTIRSISEQTNLLALNAAIEAARAGEQGRGFAVVADEVRTLAGRSAKSTDEIQQIIHLLQTEAGKAVDAMAKGQQQSSQVVESADKANAALQQIQEFIELISDQNTQVATATEEQTSVVEDINVNIEEISMLTNETTQAANHLSDNSKHLQQLSSRMDALVHKFRI